MWWLALLAFAGSPGVEKLIATGNYQEALTQLEAVEERPAAWYVQASKAYDGLNDPARAVEAVERALAIDPRFEPAHLQLGSIFLSRNTPKGALEVFTEAKALFPESLVVRLGRGLALKELQLYEEAESELAACWPNALAVDSLGTIYLHLNKFSETKELARRFIDVQPGDHRGYYFLAAAMDGLQETGAEALLRKSLERRPDFAAAHALLGKVLLRKGQLEEAARSFESAIRYRPDLTQAHLQLAQTYRKLGRDEDAAREFEIVRKLKIEEARPKPSLRYGRGDK
ncbi:MAG: tetratricopeptide repeat protein [Bryobacteraceae bacterium]